VHNLGWRSVTELLQKVTLFTHIFSENPGPYLRSGNQFINLLKEKGVLISGNIRLNYKFRFQNDYLKRDDILSIYHSNDSSSFWVSKIVAMTFCNLKKAVSFFTI